MDRTAREYVATKDDVTLTNGSVSEGDALTFIPVGEDADAGTTTGVVFLGDGRTVVRTVQNDDEPPPADVTPDPSATAVSSDNGTQIDGTGSPVPAQNAPTNPAVSDNAAATADSNATNTTTGEVR